MQGINYITDAKGNHKAVVIDLETHAELWEDIYDALLMDQRKEDEEIPYEVVKENLKQDREH